MKTMLPLRLALLGAVALFTQTAFTQTWQTVHDFRYAGHYTYLNAMGKDPFGNVYAAGTGTSNNFDDLALITKSSDGGATWSVSDAFGITPHSEVCEYLAMTSDGVGNLYALGEGWDDASQHWFVRRSQDSGATWATVLDATIDPFSIFSPRGIAADAAGNVYVAGPAWAVVKSADAGNTWSIVDDFNPGRTPRALGVICHPTLGIFMTGYADAAITTKQGKKTTTTYQHNWYVRRSLNGGVTWTTVDAFLNDGSPTQICADGLGNLYVIGSFAGTSSSGSQTHWVVRKGSSGGTSWTTVEDFFPRVGTTNYSALPHNLAADASGNVYVAGVVNPKLSSTTTGPGQWLVRKLPAGSGTWQTVDNFQYVPGRTSVAWSVVGDAFGNVFAGGDGLDATGANGTPHWLVRKLVP